MLKQAHRWAFWVGVLMVFLAVTLFLLVEQTSSRENPHQRLRVLQAVVDREGCLTCHTSTVGDLVLTSASGIDAVYHTEIYLPDASVEPTAEPLERRVDTQLVNLGQRILDVPATSSPLAATVVDGFLRADEQARASSDQAALLSTLQRLEQLEQLLRILEGQAQPNQWRETDDTFIPHSWAVVQSVSSSSYGLADARPTMLDPELACVTSCDSLTVIVASPVAFMSYRRGPPAGLRVEFVLSGVWEKIAV